MPKGIYYCPIHHRFFLLLVALLGIVLVFLFLDIVGIAFRRLFPNLGNAGVLILLATCLLGSFVNIPITKLRTHTPIIRSRYVTVLGMIYPIPFIEMKSSETILAINLGGAIIPTIASFYLISKTPSTILNTMIATALVTLVVKLTSRPVKGLGITVPGFVPPIAALIPGLLIGGSYGHVVAYVSGTLGSLIGADLLNLRVIPELGAPVASIGGAGTFDGIFLAGITAVVLF